MRESESGEECGVKHSARIKPVGSVASFLFDEESLRLGCQMSRAIPATVLGSTVTFLVSSGKRAAPCLTSAPKSSCQASVPIVAVLRRRRRRASLSLREKQHVFPRTHAALDASPDQGKGNITDRIWLRPFFLRLSKCEQRHHCFGVTLLLTWRVGAPCSISERDDIRSVHPTIGFANARRAVCIFWTRPSATERVGDDVARRACPSRWAR